MPEPEVIEEPSDESASRLAAEAGVPAPTTTTEPTYHMGVWDEPQTYICQVCNLQGVDKPTIVAHLSTAHGLPAIPTLLAQQVEDGILTPTLGMAPPPPGSTDPVPQPEEERDDARGRDDGPLLAGEQSGDAREPDVSP